MRILVFLLASVCTALDGQFLTYPVTLPPVHTRTDIAHLTATGSDDVALHLGEKFLVNTARGFSRGSKFPFAPEKALHKFKAYLNLLRDEKLATSNLQNFASIQDESARELLVSWRKFVDESKTLPEMEKVTRVNDWFNTHARFVNDLGGDKWSPLVKLLTEGGDCDDFSLAKMETLKEMGVPEAQLHVGVGDVPGYGGHAVLLYDTPDRKTTYILDNIKKNLRTSLEDPNRMRFTLSFNSLEMVFYK